MCVQYTTVAPRCVVSACRKRKSDWRATMSRSTEASSSMMSIRGGHSLSASCMRRSCPSDTVLGVHAASTSKHVTRYCRRARSRGSGQPPWAARSAMMESESSANVMFPPTPTHLSVLRHSWLSSTVSRCSVRSWKASLPMTLTTPSGMWCCPAMMLIIVLLPAPLRPVTSTRAPDSNSAEASFSARLPTVEYPHVSPRTLTMGWPCCDAGQFGTLSGPSPAPAAHTWAGSDVTTARRSSGSPATSQVCTAANIDPVSSCPPAAAAIASTSALGQKRTMVPPLICATCDAQPSSPSKM
mmetsp:Transcript_24463/g.47577  ORF Transcript_24463/g.47577 Transcript_24463/m.47577 type:complete len:298 (-) Transcript_24463:606-1499(-)